MPSHTPDERRRRRGGLLGIGDAISEAREQVGTSLRGLLEDPQGTIAQGFRDARRDPALDFSPGLGDIKAGVVDAPEEFAQGNIGPGLFALGTAVVPGPNVGKLFRGLGDLAKSGLRVFARTGTEFAVPSRRAISITPNTVPGEGPFRASILEETRTGVQARGHVHGPSEEALADVIEGRVRTGDLAERAERAGIVGFEEIPVAREARMEFTAERNAERELMRQAREKITEGKSPTGIMRKLAEGRELPGGVGGFFNP